MVQDIRAVAILLVLAILAYLLYLWSKRRDRIPCPSCGARINIYADECPHCGHKKGEPVEGEEAESAVGSAIGSVQEQPAEPSGPSEPAEPVEPSEPAELDEPEEDMEPSAAADEAADIDYEEVVQGTIPEVKTEILENEADPAKVLDAEKANKDRVTLVDWLEEQLAQQ